MFAGWKKLLVDEHPSLAEPKENEKKPEEPSEKEEHEPEDVIKPRSAKQDQEQVPAPPVNPEVLLSETTIISLEIIKRLDQYPLPQVP